MISFNLVSSRISIQSLPLILHQFASFGWRIHPFSFRISRISTVPLSVLK